MEKDILRLELLKLTTPVSSHKGPNEVIAFASQLEKYVLKGFPNTIENASFEKVILEEVVDNSNNSENAISDKAQAPDDAAKEQSVDPAIEGKKVPKNKT